MTARGDVADLLRLISLLSGRFADAGLRCDHLMLWFIASFPDISRERIGALLGLGPRSLATLEAQLRARGLLGRRGPLRVTPTGRERAALTNELIRALGQSTVALRPSSVATTREVLTALSLALHGRDDRSSPR
ncbi:MAG: hypothetical protein JNK82_17470 [Myxococcaceae bacterium]|nr:hypothetical protein [Myxococcaceae bacterium]